MEIEGTVDTKNDTVQVGTKTQNLLERVVLQSNLKLEWGKKKYTEAIAQGINKFWSLDQS